jgi:release factor glutamine methyltransferase
VARPGPSWDRLVADCALPRLEARALLALASGRSREWLVGHGDEPAPAGIAERFLALVRRRHDDGEPMAYLTGQREFHGRVFAIGPGVLIPRPETEGLVDLALELGPPDARVLELGTGSGCIAITLACVREDWHVVATDCSAAALAQARGNAERLCAPALARGRLEFLAGDWWSALEQRAPFDLIVSNPPYVAEGDPHLAAGDLRFEPGTALAAGHDGLDAIRIIVAGAPSRLARGGWLVLEHGFDQGAAVRALLAASGFDDISTRQDDAGHDRVTAGRGRQAQRRGQARR